MALKKRAVPLSGMGGAVGLVDRLTCPIVWLPTYSEEQAFFERL
jgi:hypothetical protein